MSFNILPGEFHVLSDHYVVKTRVPKEEINDAMMLSRARNANLSAGDMVVVQCMTHLYDTLLYEAEYRVVSRADAIRVVEINDRETRQITDVQFLVARKGEWWASPAVPPEMVSQATDADMEAIRAAGPGPLEIMGASGMPDKAEHRGAGSFAVLDPAGTVLCVIRKENGGKERAERIVRGEEPVPAEAA